MQTDLPWAMPSKIAFFPGIFLIYFPGMMIQEKSFCGVLNLFIGGKKGKMSGLDWQGYKANVTGWLGG